MKLTIIKDDGFMAVDGYRLDGVPMESIPSTTRALQFDGNVGHVEHYDFSVTNITDIGDYAQVLSIFADMKAEKELQAEKDADPYWGMTAEEKAEAQANRLRIYSITPRQGYIILSRYGILAAVKSYFAALEGQAGEEAQIELEFAQEWKRTWPTLISAAHSFGLTDAQIDQMFIEGAAL